MKHTLPISVVISAHNEEKNLPECLSTLHWAEEIIIIDHASTDDTGKIAREFTKHVYRRDNNPAEVDIQKNFGFSKASCPWILSLDADERVTPELVKELETIAAIENEIVGYYIPRKNIIFGKWIEHTGWYPDYQLRLFKNGKGKFVSEHVHESIKIDGKVEHLSSQLLHDNYVSVGQFVQKMMVYAPNEAKDLIKKNYRFSYLDAIRMPAREFFSRYFAREGYKDGFHGLMLSLLMGMYHLVVFACIWEAKKFIQTDEITMNDVGREIKHLYRDSNYWITNEALKQKQDPFTSLTLRIKRKVNR